MKKLSYTYEDPTGGGDDAVLVLPVTFQPPEFLKVTTGDADEDVSLVMEVSQEDYGVEVEE